MARPKNAVKTVQITISTTEPVISSLEELVETGLFGKNPAEAAERLIAKGIQELRNEDLLARENKKLTATGIIMGQFLTHEQLLKGFGPSGFIENGSPDCAEGVKYDFRLSTRILKASFKRPVDANLLSETEKRDLCVSPGEMVFVLTEERLNLPKNMVAHLSPKRKLSHAGILAICGFCIDPLYRGRLLIGLYNFSSTSFPLIPGKKVIAATFYELSKDETSDFSKPEAEVEDFPEELIRVMQNYEPMTVKSVADVVNRLAQELETLRRDIRSHEDWYKRFEESLDTHNAQIGQLTSGLAAEKESRAKGEDSLTKALQELRGTLSWLRGATWAVAGIIGIVAIPIVKAWIEGKLKLVP